MTEPGDRPVAGAASDVSGLGSDRSGFPDWLAHRARTAPERMALVAGGDRWTYSALDAEVTGVARQLATLGVGAGDRVATLLHNGAAPVLLMHALLRLGATLVPLNVRLREAELAWQIRDAAPRLLIVDSRTGELAARALVAGAARPGDQAVPGGGAITGTAANARDTANADNAAIATIDTGQLLVAASAAVATADERTTWNRADHELRLVHPADHVLALIYTSGTTGRPKGAMLTVGNFWWSAIGSALNLGTREDDRWLAVLPLFHVGGLSVLLRAAIYGITAIVHDGFDAEAVNRAIDEDGATIVSVVAVMLQRMLEARGDRPYPATLRCLLLGGGPAPRPLLERCARIGAPVVQTYGLTETASQVATLAPDDALRKLGSAGRALYPNELRIARPDGTASAPDEAGEILVRGPVVTPGYAGRPGDTARALAGGWLHTGDIGRIDTDGYLYVLDRRDDLIVTGGENVYPAEVEAVLLAHPAVAEVAVIGIADDVWGQRVVAVLRLHAGKGAADPAELREHCRARLAGYKVPREFRLVVEPLPRTATGKLRRGEVGQLQRRVPGTR